MRLNSSLVQSLFSSVFAFLPKLRKPRNFFLYILPFSIVLGRFIPPSYSSTLNDIGVSLVQLIAFPAIPLVLSAVMISIANIFGSESRSNSDRIRFGTRFIVSLLAAILFASSLALLLRFIKAQVFFLRVQSCRSDDLCSTLPIFVLVLFPQFLK